MGSFSFGCWICWLIAAVLSLECAKPLSAAVCHENVWEANTSPQKANGHTPVYIKKNQRELAEKLAQREITEMNLKNAGLRTG